MRLWVGALIVGAATFGGPVQAAELGLPLKAAPLAIPSFDWNGFYVGAHLGYAWGRSGWSGETPDTPRLGGALDFYEPWNGWTGAGSYFVGLQAGYNIVLPSRLMLGGEADVSFPSTVASAQPIETAMLGPASYGEGVLTSGTVRGRIGYAFDNWLLYVTGGFAWSFDEAVLLSPGMPITDLDDFRPLEHRLLWRLGWTIGAGFEFPFAPNWTAKAEYLFTDYGARSVLLPASELGIRSNLSLSELRFGVNYRLPATGAEVSNLTAAAIRPDLSDFAIHAQTTFISQYAAPFRSTLSRNKQSATQPRAGKLGCHALCWLAAVAWWRNLVQSGIGPGLCAE